MIRILAVTIPLIAMLIISVPAQANTASVQSLSSAVRYAKIELRRGVTERRGNNVPRYRNGRVAPYDIYGNEWCVSFVTYLWSRAGYRAYRSAPNQMRSRSGTRVAVQVNSLTRWAKRTGRFSRIPRPGYAIVYRAGGYGHLGMVTRIRRTGIPKRVTGAVPVETIEGNKHNRVYRLTGAELRRNLRDVVGYIRP